MANNLPALLVDFSSPELPDVIDHEWSLLQQSRKLFDAGFPDHALLELWNAAIHNLRRRVESYSVEIFMSSVKDQAGRKHYEEGGETVSERWARIDDAVLIAGSTRLGLLNRKGGKSLEMINWMRNHASPAHDSDVRVEQEDVVALALMLQKNLFAHPMPDPGYSPSGLFEPVKRKLLDEEGFTVLKDQIASFKKTDVRVMFGFLLDLTCGGENPAYSNARELWPLVWDRGGDELKRSAGARYHAFVIDSDADDSSDGGARLRLLELLTEVDGVQFIPDAARAQIFRKAALNLAMAKDMNYGWSDEVGAAKSLAQFGPHVPSVAFEDVYQEILAVWCGNYWGRSAASSKLTPFMKALSTPQILDLCRMFVENERVKAELFQDKPKGHALALLKNLKSMLPLEAHKAEVGKIIKKVKQY